MADTWYPRLLEPPKQSFFLFGMRDARLFGRELARVPAGQWVIVDGVQRLPALLNDVHRFIEERRLKFVLLGSSARDEALRAYVQLYLKEEVQAEALVRNLPGFARFLPVAALFHAQVLNVAGLARDAGVARTTVAGYLEILADTHLVWQLPAFEGRLRVKERKHPKLYWVDPGVARAAKGELHPPGDMERGPLLEGWVGTLRRAYGDPATGLGARYEGLFYWAPAEGAREVDFLLRRRTELVAVEVKAKRTLAPGDFAGLRAVAELPAVRRRLVVFLGDRPFRTEDGIDALPVPAFVEALEQGAV